MALSFSTVVHAYQDDIKDLPFIPKESFKGSVMGADGLPTNIFLGFSLLDHAIGVKFIQECGLLKGEIICHTCSSNMQLWRSNITNEYRWKYGKREVR
jgi:hypothetical protein